MSLKYLQNKQKEESEGSIIFNTPQDIMLAATEELGEVAQEVALIEKSGTKVNWEKEPSKERLSEEINQTINCLIALANYYEVDLG